MTNPHPDLPLSRWSDPRSLVLGTRVIVRRRLTEHGPHGTHLTDVIGHIRQFGPLIIEKADGELVTIPHNLVDVIKTLPAQVVRNSDIRAVEWATALAFPGVHHQWVDGWLVRISDGVTERSNSAVPLEPHTAFNPVPLDAIRKVFHRHGLPVQLEVPDRIARTAFDLPGIWDRGPEIVVMTRDITQQPELLDEHIAAAAAATGIQGLQWEVTDQASPQWLGLYHFRGKPLPESTLQLLCTQIQGRMGFGQIRVDGQVVAITRGTITSSPDGRVWLGYSAVEVDARWRRRGLATLLGLVMVQWGHRMGASHAYLQVIESNDAGRALYRRLGFGEHHRHRYLVERAPGPQA